MLTVWTLRCCIPRCSSALHRRDFGPERLFALVRAYNEFLADSAPRSSRLIGNRQSRSPGSWTPSPSCDMQRS